MAHASSAMRRLALATAAALWVANVAAAEPRTWDQAAVTALAGELVERVKALRSAHRQTPPPQVGSGDSRAHLALTDGLRLIRNESRHLKRELEQGKGREETLPVAKRLRSLIDSARVDARKLRLTSPLLDEIQATNAALAQLWEYYGLAADPGT